MKPLRAVSCILLSLVGTAIGPGLASPSWGATSFSASTQGEVSARVLWKKARRDVSLNVEVSGLRGVVEVILDRPVQAALGITAAQFELSVRGADGAEIVRVPGKIEAGTAIDSLEVEFPVAGEYQVALNQRDVRIGPARVRFQPEEELSVVIRVGR